MSENSLVHSFTGLAQVLFKQEASSQRGWHVLSFHYITYITVVSMNFILLSHGDQKTLLQIVKSTQPTSLNFLLDSPQSSSDCMWSHLPSHLNSQVIFVYREMQRGQSHSSVGRVFASCACYSGFSPQPCVN